MKEYKVGEQIVLEVKEVACSCEYCFFEHCGCNLKYEDRKCSAKVRSDGKNVIFVEKRAMPNIDIIKELKEIGTLYKSSDVLAYQMIKDLIEKLKKAMSMGHSKYIPGDFVMYKGNICEIMSADNGDKRHSQYSVIEVGKGIESFKFAHEREIEPIPLTSNILKKSGWEDNGWYDFTYKDKLYLFNTEYDKKHNIISTEVHSNASPCSDDVGQDDFYLTTISCVHQLQHLLYGLGIKSKIKV